MPMRSPISGWWTVSLHQPLLYQFLLSLRHLLWVLKLPPRPHCLPLPLSSMTLLILALPFIRTAPHPILLELHLETPIWAHNWQWLQRLYVFTATMQGIFMLTAQNTSVLTAANEPPATPSTIACVTTVLLLPLRPSPLLLSGLMLHSLWWPRTCHHQLSLFWGPQQWCHL